MLIDVSRRPARLIMEECPTVLVIRTMSIKGRSDGLLHHERDKEREKYERLKHHRWDPPPPASIHPKATLPQGDIEYIETIIDPFKYRETYSVTGFQDQVAKTQGVWRINFLIEEVQSGMVLTLLDETHSTMLFTVQIDSVCLKGQSLFGVTTPIRRHLNKTASDNKAPGLWGALMGDDDF